MANFVKYFLFSCLFVVTLAVDDSKPKLADTKDCTNFCEFHFPSSDHFSTCARGCRFYAISNMIGLSLQAAQTKCLESCSEAYMPGSSTSEELTPCELGCAHQWSLAQQANEMPMKDDTAVNRGAAVDPAAGDDVEVLRLVVDGSAPSANTVDDKAPVEKEESGMVLSFDRPVMQVRKVVAQVRGAFHILKTSVLTYFLQDDDTLLAVQSQPEVIVGVAPQEGFNSPEEVLQEAENKPQAREEGIMSDGFGTIHVSGFGADGSGMPPQSSGVEVVALSSRRSAYLLHLLLLLAVVSLALLGLSYCLAAARHQQRRTLKAANLATAVQKEPLKLVRPEDLTKLSLMEEEDTSHQAPPLPLKQDLALTHAKV